MIKELSIGEKVSVDGETYILVLPDDEESTYLYLEFLEEDEVEEE